MKKVFLEKTLTQVLSCEFCELSKNTFFTEQLRATASITIRVTYPFVVDFILSVISMIICQSSDTLYSLVALSVNVKVTIRSTD